VRRVRNEHRAIRTTSVTGMVELAAVWNRFLGASLSMVSMIGCCGQRCMGVCGHRTGEFEGGGGVGWGLDDTGVESGLLGGATGVFAGTVFGAAGEGDGLGALGGGRGWEGSVVRVAKIEEALEGAEGAGDVAEAVDGAVRAGESGQDQEASFGEGSGGAGEAEGAGFEAGLDVEAGAGVSVGLALGAVEEPGDGGALAGDGLVDAGFSGPDHPGTGVFELHEEVGVFACGFVEAEVEAELAGVEAAEEDVVGLDEVDGRAGGVLAGCEEVAFDDPFGGAVVGGDDGAADDIGVVEALDGEEGVDPERVGGLVVVEEGDEVGSGGLGEGAVAGVGEALAALDDVVGGIGELVADDLEGGGAGAGDVVVDEDEFELDVGVLDEPLGSERKESGAQHHWTLIGKHADGDGNRARSASLERRVQLHRAYSKACEGWSKSGTGGVRRISL